MMVVRHLEGGSISFSRRASDEQLENEGALSRALSRALVEWSNWKERRPPLGKALELEIKAVFKTRKEEVQVQIENTAKQCCADPLQGDLSLLLVGCCFAFENSFLFALKSIKPDLNIALCSCCLRCKRVQVGQQQFGELEPVALLHFCTFTLFNPFPDPLPNVMITEVASFIQAL